MFKNIKIILTFVVFSILFIYSGNLVEAKADDLLITSDGSIILILSDNGPVLGLETTDGTKSFTNLTKVLVAPAHAQDLVKIDPKPTKDHKVEVTIETKNLNKKEGSTEIKKTVNQVVAEGKDKKPVFSIKANKSDQMTINQGGVEASTPLPLQIDTTSKRISTQIGSQNVNIQVLPKDVAKVAEGKGMGKNLQESDKKEKIQLTVQNNQPVYKVNGNRKGAAFGINFTSPVEVDISAQTGKTTKVFQPFIFNVLDFLGR